MDVREITRLKKQYVQLIVKQKLWVKIALVATLVIAAAAMVALQQLWSKPSVPPIQTGMVASPHTHHHRGARPRQPPSPPSVIPPIASAPHSSIKPFGLAMGDTLPWLSQAQLNSELNSIASLGVSWIRIDVSWADVQPDSAAQYDWSGLDKVAAAARNHGLKILATLAYTPAWARTGACGSSQQCAPASDRQFAAFAATAVQRYAPQGVHTWEIWNEPNLEGFWQPAPSPSDYTHLLEASYPAIKQVDPSAIVLTGGLGPLDDSPLSMTQQTFLNDIYIDGAKPYFDAIGYHPYSFPALPSEVVSWSGWSTMNDVPGSIRSIMAAYGDSAKQIWITEFGAPTNGQTSVDHVNENTQAEMLTEAANQYKADSWLGSFFWYNYQDLGTATSDNNNFFGLLRYDGSPKPAYAAYQNEIKGN